MIEEGQSNHRWYYKERNSSRKAYGQRHRVFQGGKEGRSDKNSGEKKRLPGYRMRR